jgi:hypothetical protein
MRLLRTGLGLFLAAAFCGCGDSGVTEGTVPFKATDTSQFDQMKNDMMKNVTRQGSRTTPGSAPGKTK